MLSLTANLAEPDFLTPYYCVCVLPTVEFLKKTLTRSETLYWCCF